MYTHTLRKQEVEKVINSFALIGRDEMNGGTIRVCIHNMGFVAYWVEIFLSEFLFDSPNEFVSVSYQS